MGSSNSVRVTTIEETSYGVTPVTGSFDTARFTAETLSGTPNTVESKQIRTDRMSSGQVVVGLGVAGSLDIELAKESALDKYLASAMYSDWVTTAPVTVDLSINASTLKLTRATGSWISDAVIVGDFLTLTGFTNAANNAQVMVAAIDSATVLSIVGSKGLVTEVATGTTYQVADKLTIGVTKKSFSVEKAFLDLTTKAIIYRGMIVSSLDLKFAYGELATGALGFSGNDYLTVDDAPSHITDGRTINAAATSQTLNGSVDMPFLASSAVGALAANSFDLQSVALKLNNNLNAVDVIGAIAPKDYSAGTAQITLDLSAYMTDAAWSILDKKLTQFPFALAFQVKNAGGWYAFYLPQVQVSFADPASAGQNQDIILSMTGTAKVGASGESAMTIYRG